MVFWVSCATPSAFVVDAATNVLVKLGTFCSDNFCVTRKPHQLVGMRKKSPLTLFVRVLLTLVMLVDCGLPTGEPVRLVTEMV